MRRTRLDMGLLAAALLSLTGCQTPNTTIKPPLHEEYTLPPSNDSRFSSPPTYPKETLESSQFKKQPNKPGEQFQGPGRFGAGASGNGGY
jgi:hypothetical protein